MKKGKEAMGNMAKEKCPFCPKKYQSENDLKKHLGKIHNASYTDAMAMKNKNYNYFNIIHKPLN